MESERKAEILRALEGIDEPKKMISRPLVDDMVFLEERLSELRKFPFIKVHPRDKAQQKVTPAGKQYKEFLQQYNNCVKILCSLLKKGDEKDESPLRKYLRTIEND